MKKFCKSLFIISSLPRPTISVRGIFEGREPLSGSLNSFLLVVEELARRGRPVGIIVLEGGSLVDTSIRVFEGLESAVAWVENGTVVWCSWGDHKTLHAIGAAGVKPIMWLQTDIDSEEIHFLKAGMI